MPGERDGVVAVDRRVGGRPREVPVAGNDGPTSRCPLAHDRTAGGRKTASATEPPAARVRTARAAGRSPGPGARGRQRSPTAACREGAGAIGGPRRVRRHGHLSPRGPSTPVVRAPAPRPGRAATAAAGPPTTPAPRRTARRSRARRAPPRLHQPPSPGRRRRSAASPRAGRASPPSISATSTPESTQLTPSGVTPTRRTRPSRAAEVRGERAHVERGAHRAETDRPVVADQRQRDAAGGADPQGEQQRCGHGDRRAEAGHALDERRAGSTPAAARSRCAAAGPWTAPGRARSSRRSRRSGA